MDLRAEIRAIVSSIEPADTTEADHQADVLAWIDSGAELFRKVSPATPPKHLVSYFLLFDEAEQQVLLVDHRKAGLWLPSGGHVDPEEHPRDTAHRELTEELGVSLPLLTPGPLFVTVTPTQGVIEPHIDVSLWYVFRASCQTKFDYDTREFHTVRWFHLDELPLERTDPHLARFREKLLQRRVTA